MILDDLFNQAAQVDIKKATVYVAVAVTTNQTGGFKSTNTNKSFCSASMRLDYSPQHQVKGPRGSISFSPANFSTQPGANPSVTITAPPSVPIGKPYGVEMLGTSFVPAVDAATNIVYGAAGSVFVTISICGYGTTGIVM